MLNRPSIFTLALAGIGFFIYMQPDVLKGQSKDAAQATPSALASMAPSVPYNLNLPTMQAAMTLLAQNAAPEVLTGNPDDRRAKLDERERALDKREALLKAAEQRLAEKINELKLLQASIERHSAANQAQPASQAKPADQDREEQLRRLARVYEDMKPREAAKIFEQMDQNLALDVAQRMKSFKLSPVLAVIEPKKATQFTAELAKRKPVPRPAPPQGIGG